MSPMLTIYHAPRSRSNRVVWLCEEMGVPYEIVSVQLGEKPPELIAHNPGATVPLMTDDGLVLFESVTMLEYIADRYGPTDLVLPPHHPNYWDYRQMLLFGEATLAAPLNAVVSTLFRAPENEQQNHTRAAIQAAFDKRIGVVAQRLARGPYIAGEAFTLADISVVYAIGLVRAMNAGGAGLSLPAEAVAYYRLCADRPAYQRMTKVR